ncbi:squalene synthase HpnC [Lichenicoccus sp.]|uniref:squalene synthase HpnC n=1 Tax=Lichenicoccus sp. TaxID=2781899 RepID=UPI003D0BE620
MSIEVASGKGRADENFPVGSWLIAPRQRPHVHAYYGFARAIDDIADNIVLTPAAKIARLDAMESVLLTGGAAHAGLAPSEQEHALRLRASLAATGVDPRTATDLIVAFRQDAVKPRYQSWQELADYCRYSACPVGRYLLALHGEPGEATRASSDALCSALQVLNHLQDCADDLAALDRCYIPEPWLAAEGLGVDALRGPRAPAGLRRVFDRLLGEVATLNRAAASLPARIADRRMRLEAAVIVGVSHRLAARLARKDPLAARVRLRKPDLVLCLLGAVPTWRRA